MHHNIFTALVVFVLFLAFSCTPKTTTNLLKNDTDRMAVSVSPPQKVSASDGTYPTHVLVCWDAVPNADSYLVFRAASDQPNQKKQITKQAQQSNWLPDYSAQANVKYIYEIQAVANGNNSAYSIADIGYLQLNEEEPLAFGGIDFSISLAQNSYSTGEDITIAYELPKAIPYTSQLRFYISEDNIFDWKDTYLTNMQPRTFTPNAPIKGQIQVTVPTDITTGSYSLLAVYSIDGTVEASGVVATDLQIK